MPLLRRQVFQRQKPSPDLSPDVEVFHCRMTNEIFRDYEEFFERIILCNSLVWSCSVTGRSGMTFQEALECEERARKHLATFPDYLEKPILYLASLTHRSRLVDMNDDVFVFAKDRFFKGEVVDVMHGSQKKVCKIMKIVVPSVDQLLNGSAPDSSEASDSEIEELDSSTGSPKKRLKMKPSQFMYAVLEENKTNTIIVKAGQVSRRKGVYTRDKSKLYLKQHCEPEYGLWKVKEAVLRRVGLEGARFEDFFFGPPPAFAISQVKKKTNARKLNASKSASETSPSPDKKKRKKMEPEEKKKKHVKKIIEPVSSVVEEVIISLSKEERAAQREREKEERRLVKLAEKEEMKKRMDEMREKMKEERAKEKEKQREEKMKQLEIMREWSRPREDLECDDLQEMPEPTPIQTNIPTNLFGEVIMVLEFLQAFSEVFDPEDQFPLTFTFEMMERALLDHDINSPLTELLKFLLSTIFNLQDEEEEEEEELLKEYNKGNLLALDMTADIADDDYGLSDVSTKQLIQSATMASSTPQLYHGTSIRRMGIDSYTLTEVLRLHFMVSGARAGAKNNKFRYQQRGGYTPLDDAGLEFKQLEPGIMKNLSTGNVFDFTPEEIMKIVNHLMQQIITYAAARDFIEDNFERIRQQKMDLKQLQWGEMRREREEAQAKYRKKMEERARERERQAEMKALKVKEREGQLQGEENNVENPNKVDKDVEIIEEGEIVKKPEPSTKCMSPQAVKRFIKELDGKVACSLNRDSRAQRQRSKKQVEEIPTVNELLTEFDKVDEDMLDPEELELFRFKREELEVRRKEEYAAREKEFSANLLKFQSGYAVYPVGRDRLYRRYWLFHSMPGLFIENNDEFVPEYMIQQFTGDSNASFGVNHLPLKSPNTSKHGIEDKSTSSDKENESFELPNGNGATPNNQSNKGRTTSEQSQEIPVIDLEAEMEQDAEDEDVKIVDDDKPPELDYYMSKQAADSQRVMWSYINTNEQFDTLLKSLNSRGFREGVLKQNLQEQKLRILDSIRDCPKDTLHIPSLELRDSKNSSGSSHSSKSGKKSPGAVKSDTAQELLELTLRDMLLDIEERIYVGSLGSIKVKDRVKWRDAIERGGYDPQTSDPTFNIPEDGSNKPDEDQMSESSDCSLALVRDLAMALLQLERALDAKYMTKPLGEADNAKKVNKKAQTGKDKNKKKGKGDKKIEDSDSNDEDECKPVVRTTLERWEDSLLQCTGLSQVFLYLATLEKSITWSKSALHARCRICRRKGDAEKMLLCDGCDRGHHMYCLKPVVKHVPQGDWYCPDCRPKEVRTPRKGRRRTFSEETDEEEEEEEDDGDGSNEESSDDEEEADSDEVEEESEEEEDPNDNTCSVCLKGGKLICCDNCPLSYHLKCARPVLSKVPRGKWLCQICSDAEKQKGKIKIGKAKPKKTTASSSQSGSRRNSPLTVKTSAASKSKRRHSDEQEVTPGTSRQGSRLSRLSLEPDGGAESDSGTPKQSLSSFRGNSKVQLMKACEDLVNDIIKEEAAWPFLKPVSKKLVPDYYDIISKPMDFSTIRNRVNRFEYSDPSPMLADVRQIFANCELYNLKTTQEYKAGMKLSKMFEKRVQDLGLEEGEDGPAPVKRPRRH